MPETKGIIILLLLIADYVHYCMPIIPFLTSIDAIINYYQLYHHLENQYSHYFHPR